MIRRIGLCLFTIAAIASSAAVAGRAETVLTHHVREASRSGLARSIGRLPANQTLQLDLVLPVRDRAGLDQFVKDVQKRNAVNELFDQVLHEKVLTFLEQHAVISEGTPAQ